MQEVVINILLSAVIIMAASLLIVIGCRKDGMTKKQRIMMIRILISAGILLALFISVCGEVDSFCVLSDGLSFDRLRYFKKGGKGHKKPSGI